MGASGDDLARLEAHPGPLPHIPYAFFWGLYSHPWCPMAGITTAKQRGISMRGILSFGRSIINEVQEFGFKQAMANLREDAERAVDAVFAFHWHPKGVHHGAALYVRVPYTRLSTFIYWHDTSLGRGVERSRDGLNIYLWRLQVNLCREQGVMYGSDL